MDFWSKEFSEDFHYYVGRRLGITNKEIESGLGVMFGKRTDYASHYFALKKFAECGYQRSVVLEIIMLYTRDFLGTEWCNKYEKSIQTQAKCMTLETLEKYLRNVVLPDGNYDLWLHMLYDFNIDPPSKNLNIDKELKRLGLPSCYTKYINSNAYVIYYKDRRFRNLAYATITTASNIKEFDTAEKIQKRFLGYYYRQMGINTDIENYKYDLFDCSGVITKPLCVPFLPKLNCMKYDKDFYDYVYNIVRGEHNLFNLEWNLAKCVRFSHHTIIVNTLDRTTNDSLEFVKNVKDLYYLTFQNNKEQNEAIKLLSGDYGSCLFSSFVNDIKVQDDSTISFIQSWYDHNPIYVLSSIEKSYNDGGLDINKMGYYMKRNLHHHPKVCNHLHQSKPFGCH